MHEGWVRSVLKEVRSPRERACRTEVRRMLDALPQMVIEVDRDLRGEFVNTAMAEWLPEHARRLVGSTLVEVLGAEYVKVMPSVRAVLAGGRARARLTFDACGTRRDLEIIAIPRTDPSGAINGLIAFITDETARRRVEERERFLVHATEVLASSIDYEQTLRAVVDLAIPVQGDFAAVEIVREDGTLEEVAMAHTDLTRMILAGELRRRYPPREGSLVRRVIRAATAELRERVSSDDLAAIAHDETHGALLRRLGLWSLLVVPITAHGVVFGALVLATTDASRRVYGEEDVAFAGELARRAGVAIENAKLYELTRYAVLARDDLLATVSHDLRNPLGAIRVKAEIMRERIDELGNPRGLNIEIIQRAADRMLKLVESLTDATRVAAGRIMLDRRTVDLASMARDTLEVLQPLGLAKRLQTSLHAIDGAMVQADPDRIAQVLENLIGNAIKFTPSGGLISVEVSAAEAAGEIEVAVRDTGSGIAPEEVEHVFDRFWQARDRRAGGSGLGLFIARGIVEAHGGRIGVDSRVGEGTRVWFTLPRAGVPEDRPGDDRSSARRATGGQGSGSRGP